MAIIGGSCHVGHTKKWQWIVCVHPVKISPVSPLTPILDNEAKMIYIQCQRSVPVQEGVCPLCWEAESRTFMQKTRVCVTSLQLMFVFLLTVTTITTSYLIHVVRYWQGLPKIGGAWSSVVGDLLVKSRTSCESTFWIVFVIKSRSLELHAIRP